MIGSLSPLYGVSRNIVANIKNSNQSTSYRSGTASGRVGKFYPSASAVLSDLNSSVNSALSSLKSLKSRDNDSVTPGFVPFIDSGSSGSSGGYSPEKQKYYEAPLAELYGFDKTTAYQEALSNTSYRREMADMRKAGLNPSVIYGSHNTSGAGSNIYPSSGSSVSAGSSGRSFASGRSNSGKMAISGGLYYGTMAAVSAITSIATRNVAAGMMAGSIAGTALKALNGFLSK